MVCVSFHRRVALTVRRSVGERMGNCCSEAPKQADDAAPPTAPIRAGSRESGDDHSSQLRPSKGGAQALASVTASNGHSAVSSGYGHPSGPAAVGRPASSRADAADASVRDGGGGGGGGGGKERGGGGSSDDDGGAREPFGAKPRLSVDTSIGTLLCLLLSACWCGSSVYAATCNVCVLVAPWCIPRLIILCAGVSFHAHVCSAVAAARRPNKKEDVVTTPKTIPGQNSAVTSGGAGESEGAASTRHITLAVAPSADPAPPQPVRQRSQSDPTRREQQQHQEAQERRQQEHEQQQEQQQQRQQPPPQAPPERQQQQQQQHTEQQRRLSEPAAAAAAAAAVPPPAPFAGRGVTASADNMLAEQRKKRLWKCKNCGRHFWGRDNAEAHFFCLTNDRVQRLARKENERTQQLQLQWMQVQQRQLQHQRAKAAIQALGTL